MSMSQLKTPDEEWDEICSNIHWYHIPLILASLFIFVPLLSLFSFVRFWKGKK